jgi:hypothetical protein
MFTLVACACLVHSVNVNILLKNEWKTLDCKGLRNVYTCRLYMSWSLGTITWKFILTSIKEKFGSLKRIRIHSSVNDNEV